MRTNLISVLVLLLFAGQAVGYPIETECSILDIDRNAELAGVRLGEQINDEFSALPEGEGILERKSYPSEGIKWYRHARAPKTIDGADIRYVYYGFKENRLVEIMLGFETSDEQKSRTHFLRMLEKHFGGARFNNEMWLWTGKNVGLDFTGYCGLDSCTLSVLYIFPKERAGKPITTEKPPA